VVFLNEKTDVTQVSDEALMTQTCKFTHSLLGKKVKRECFF